jgi:hypothetical protein
MTAECTQVSFEFQPLKNRDVDGLLLREVEKRTGILHQFASCFTKLSESRPDFSLLSQMVECAPPQNTETGSLSPTKQKSLVSDR